MESHADPLTEFKPFLFPPSILWNVEMCLLSRCRDLQELKITALICQMMQLYRRGWKKRTVTSDLKIDGKKEITAQKGRLLTWKERGVRRGFASPLPSQLCGVCSVHPFISRYQSSCGLDAGSWGFSLFSQCLSGFKKEESQLFRFESNFISTKPHHWRLFSITGHFLLLFSLRDGGRIREDLHGELQSASPQAPTKLECSSHQAPYSARRIDRCHKNSFQIIATVQPSLWARTLLNVCRIGCDIFGLDQNAQSTWACVQFHSNCARDSKKQARRIFFFQTFCLS